MTISRNIKAAFSLFGGSIVLATAGLALGILLGRIPVHQKQPALEASPASAVEANVSTLETAQEQCTRVHGTMRVELVNRHSSDRALVCDVSKDLSITLGTIRN